MAAPRAGAHIERRFAQKNQLKSAENVALHFRERATLQQAKSMTYLTSTRANCRRWGTRSRRSRRNGGQRGLAVCDNVDADGGHGSAAGGGNEERVAVGEPGRRRPHHLLIDGGEAVPLRLELGGDGGQRGMFGVVGLQR